jgi:L-amino acid N-acyltransferase YncA
MPTFSLCSDADKKPILDIINHAIIHTTALYDYEPRGIESMDAWFETKRRGGFPVVGLYDPERTLLGFGTYGSFRNWPAYKYSVEHSIYIKDGERGKGHGKRILQNLVERAEAQGYHTLIAGIDSENTVSIKLHEKLGFNAAGTILQVGYKFGRWLDLVFMQKVLLTPRNPTVEIDAGVPTP